MSSDDILGLLVGLVAGMVVLGGWLSARARAQVAAEEAQNRQPKPTKAPPVPFEIPQLPPRPNPADDGFEGLSLEEVALRCLASAGEDPSDPDLLEALFQAPSEARIPPSLAAVAPLVAAVRRGDPGVLVNTPAELSGFADLLFAGRWPLELAARVAELGGPPGPALVRSLARLDPERLLRLLPKEDPMLWGEAICGLLDAGQPVEPFLAPWLAGQEAGGRGWQCLELRRLARVDIEAAGALFEALDEEPGPLAEADFFAALARQDPERALREAERPGYETDRLPRLSGCARAGLEVGPALARIRDALGPQIYDPWTVFKGLLAIDLTRGDAAGVEATVRAGGARGWQITSAAWMYLRAPADSAPLLSALRLPVEPGVVRSRDVDLMGIPAGKVAMRPAWLRRAGPKPLDRLSLFAAPGGVDWRGE